MATATACALLGLECIVYMGEIDIARQAPNVARMKMLGATVIPATSGSKTLKDAVNEALRDWINNASTTHYIIGSVVGPHPFPDMVARFQSIISEEIRFQLKEHIGRENPDYVIACVGGGSNAAGTFYHFVDEPVLVSLPQKLVALVKIPVRAPQPPFGNIRNFTRQPKSCNADRRRTGYRTLQYICRAGLSGYWSISCTFIPEKRAEFFSINDDEH